MKYVITYQHINKHGRVGQFRTGTFETLTGAQVIAEGIKKMQGVKNLTIQEA